MIRKDKISLLVAIGGAALLWCIKKAAGVNGIGKCGVGKVERIKRRIYKEVSLAQKAGVDFTKKYDELSAAEKNALKRIGNEVGWKQSKIAIQNGKSYTDSYYNSLRRAWNTVSGIEGIGRAYQVKDANGNVCLTWIEDAKAHYDAEQRTLEAEQRAMEARKRLQSMRRKVSGHITQSERMERYDFGVDFYNQYAATHQLEVQELTERVNEKVDKERPMFWEIAVNLFADNKLRIKNIRNSWPKAYLYGEWHGIGFSRYKFCEELLSAWRERELNAGFTSDIDSARIALLDKAQHMVVFTPDGVITGKERYDYLDCINWIIMVRENYNNTASKTQTVTIYPKAAFETKDEAEKHLYSSGVSPNIMQSSLSVIYSEKIVPVFEVNINAISGTEI